MPDDAIQVTKSGKRFWVVLLVATSIAAHSLAALPTHGQSTTAIPVRPRTTIVANLASKQFEASLPFEEDFLVRVKWPGEYSTVTLTYGTLSWINNAATIGQRIASETVNKSDLYENPDAFFRIRPLKSGVDYLFLFTIPAGAPPSEIARIHARPKADFGNHFDQDLGIMLSHRAGYLGVVSSMHVHFVPINKNASGTDFPFSQRLLRNTSLFLGLTVAEIDSDATVEKFFAAGSPVFGLAVRPIFGRPVRFAAGLVVFKQDDANPLVDTKRNKVDRFIMATADLDLKALLGPLLAIIGIK